MDSPGTFVCNSTGHIRVKHEFIDVCDQSLCKQTQETVSFCKHCMVGGDLNSPIIYGVRSIEVHSVSRFKHVSGQGQFCSFFVNSLLFVIFLVNQENSVLWMKQFHWHVVFVSSLLLINNYCFCCQAILAII